MKHSNITAKFFATILPAALLIGCSAQEPTTDAASSDETTQVQTETSKNNQASTETSTSLSEQLSEKAAESATRFPEKVRETFQAGIQLVRDSGIEKTAKQVGDQAIDGELIGWDGETVRLGKLWHDGPIILMWYRGGWCPYCNLQLRAMQQKLNEIENSGASLVVLTPELPGKAKETAENSGLEIVALHDRDNQLAKEYGIMFDLPQTLAPMYRDKIKLPSYNGTDKLQLPLAATYVIDRSGKITYAFLDADYKKRAEPSDILDAVKAALER